MGLTRRDFLGIVGGAGAGLGLAQLPLRRLVGFDDLRNVTSVPGVERWVKTSCQICPGACGMEVRIVDGNPVGLRGNPLHPVSRGGLCPVGVEAMHLLYSPDRFQSPLKGSSAARPHSDWRGLGWDEALGDLGAIIARLKAESKADRIYLIDGYGRGLLSEVAKGFMTAIGSPNYYVEQKAGPIAAAAELAFGLPQIHAYDLENANTILSFGVPLIEGWESPVHGNRVVGGIRRSGTKDRSRALIHLDVRSSRTSHQADIFKKIQPGSFGAAALAIAYVMISQKLYDQDYVEAKTSGFEDWVDEHGEKHMGFKTYVLEHCHPQDLESKTGMSNREVLEIAQHFASHRPSVAMVDATATETSNGIQTAVAIQALNALVGAVDQPGGVILPDKIPFGVFPQAFSADAVAEPSYPDAEDLIQSVAAGEAQIELLLLLHADPFTSIPQGHRFQEALGDATLVSFSPLPDETTRLADYVLPDLSFLERWQDAVAPPSFSCAAFGITQPVTKPLCNARNSGDVLLQLARKVEGADLRGIPWKDFEQLLKAAAVGTFEARRGSAFTTEREALEIREMERRGWWIPPSEDADAAWDELLTSGGWWDPAFPYGVGGRVFHTPDRRYNFFSLGSKAKAKSVQEDVVFLPHLEDPKWHGETGGDSLHLYLVHPMVPNTAVAASFPWVREILNEHVAWDAWVDLHEKDASRLGIANGEMVEIVASHSSFRARALVSKSSLPGLIVAPCGIGRRGGGRWAELREANPRTVVVPRKDPVAGCFLTQGTKVKIHKINGGENHG